MKSILFRPELIPLIRDGKKTVTRRDSGLKEINRQPDAWLLPPVYDYGYKAWAFFKPDSTQVWVKSRFHAGEVVYVKEAYICYGRWINRHGSWDFITYYDVPHYFLEDPLLEGIEIISGHNENEGWYKRTPLFMPERFARYFLLIKEVTPERFRLGNLTIPDIEKEGGQVALPYLRLLEGKWVFRYEFELTERR